MPQQIFGSLIIRRANLDYRFSFGALLWIEDLRNQGVKEELELTDRSLDH